MVWAGEGLSLSSKQSKLGRIKNNGPNQTPSDKVHGSFKKKKKKKKLDNVNQKKIWTMTLFIWQYSRK